MNAKPVRLGFDDRLDAGRQLAGALARFAGAEHLVILALPRGGVPVAAEVAKALAIPFDVLIVRKLGVPGHEEFAFGAIASGGIQVTDMNLISRLGLKRSQIDAIIQREMTELARRERFYRNGRAMPAIEGKTVILVDDGIATGSTMLAAIGLLRSRQAHRIIVAVPVAPGDTARRLREQADEVITLLEPEAFVAVGEWYADFSQTSDDEVRELLAKSHPHELPFNK